MVTSMKGTILAWSFRETTPLSRTASLFTGSLKLFVGKVLTI